MKYTDYYSHLNEGWTTYKPNNNQKVLLYDFYVLSYLSTLPVDPTQKGYGGTFLGRNPNEIKLDIEHAQSVLLPVLVKKLKNALFFAVCAELRHMFDRTQDFSLYEHNKLLKYYVRYYKSLVGDMPKEFQHNRPVNSPRVNSASSAYTNSYKAAIMAIKKAGSSRTAFGTLAAELFKELDWASSYGGPKWAEIAEGYILLDKAHTNNEKQIAIDHAYDLQHNTGTALNKVKDFAINNSYDWLQKVLDHKRDAKSMYELLPHCSSDMRKLALEAFKIANIKDSNRKPEQPAKNNNVSNGKSFNVGDAVFFVSEVGNKYEAIVIGDVLKSASAMTQKIKITKIIKGKLNLGDIVYADLSFLKLIPEERKKYNFKIGDKVLFKSLTTGASYYGDINAITPHLKYDSTILKNIYYKVNITKVVSGFYGVGQNITADEKELTLINTQPDSFKPGDAVIWTAEVSGHKYEAIVVGDGVLKSKPSKKIKITKVISKAPTGITLLPVGSEPSAYETSLKHNIYI